MTNQKPVQRVFGTAASGPWSMGRDTWLKVIRRAWSQAGSNNVGLISAGVAFYCFTAIVPALASIVLSYGLLADADTVSRHVNGLFGFLPQEAAMLVSEQLVGVVSTSEKVQGLGLIVALLVSLYGATKATSSMIVALNVAYEEKEARGFLRLTVLSLLLVAGGVALALIALALTGTLAFLGSLIPSAPAFVVTGIRILSYLLLAGLVLTAAACLYRYAPSRPSAKWQWVTPGAVIATIAWLAATAGFGFYASNFGSYNATYGSLGAVVILLTWLWLSVYVFLFGAQLNGELERRTTEQPLEVRKPTAEAPAQVEADGPDAAGPGAIAEPRTMGLDAILSKASIPSRLTVTRAYFGTMLPLEIGARATGSQLRLSTALLAGAGLARLRRGSKAGVALLAGAALLAWSKRRSLTKSRCEGEGCHGLASAL